MTKKAVSKSKTTGKTAIIQEQAHYTKVGRLYMSVAKAIKREAADIYISQNNIRHVFIRHRKEIEQLGFTPESFVNLVVIVFNHIYKGTGESLLLVLQNGKSKVVAIEMNYALKKGFYEVKTAFVTDKKTLDKKELLWKK